MWRILCYNLIIILLALCSCKKDKEIKSSSPFDFSEGQMNWTKIPFDTIKYDVDLEFSGLVINDICFINSQIGFLAGYKVYHESASIIYRTIIGGNAWVSNYKYGCGAGSTCHSVFFSSLSHGFATFSCFGKGFSETLNGGVSWFKNNNVVAKDVPNQHYVIDSLNIIVGDIRTNDGGNTWQTINPPLNTTSYFFRNVNYGICATSDGLIAETYNLGNTWDTIYYCNSCSFSCITQSDSLTIIAGGNKIVKSADKGINWIETYSLPDYVYDIKFINHNIGFAAISNVKFDEFEYVGNADLSGYILKTTNGGNTWSINYHSDFIGFKTLEILDANTIISAGIQSKENENIKNGYIIKTTTQGE